MHVLPLSGRLRSLAGALRRPRGSEAWDRLIRASGVVAAVALPIAVWFPQTAELAGFVLVTIWVNGPLAPFLPATYEPILMLLGRIHPPLLVATLGILGTLYVEFLNYQLYRRLWFLEALQRTRESPGIGRIVKLFRRAPFFTVWLCSWSPLPYWPVRFLSPLAGYPVRRHLLATLLGRFPRLWFFASLGAYWSIGSVPLLVIALGSATLGVGVWLWKSRQA